MSIRGYDFTYLAGQATGAPLAGTMQGRWWTWNVGALGSPQLDRAAADALFSECAKNVQPPQRLRVTALDMEGHGSDYADRERIVANFLDAWGEISPAKLLVIDFWLGMPPEVSFREIVAALDGPASKPRTAMFAHARRHRELARKAGVVTQLGNIDRPDGGAAGPNTEFGTSFYLHKIRLQAAFFREAYPGTELCCWTSGAYTRIDGFPELSDPDCQRLADAIFENYDSFAIYGETRHNQRLGKVLSDRLLSGGARAA